MTENQLKQQIAKLKKQIKHSKNTRQTFDKITKLTELQGKLYSMKRSTK